MYSFWPFVEVSTKMCIMLHAVHVCTWNEWNSDLRSAGWKCNTCRLKCSHTAQRSRPFSCMHFMFQSSHVRLLVQCAQYIGNWLCMTDRFLKTEEYLVRALWFCTTSLQDCSAYAIQEVLLTYECSESKKDGLVIMFQISILVHVPFVLQNIMLTRCQSTQVY